MDRKPIATGITTTRMPLAIYYIHSCYVYSFIATDRVKCSRTKNLAPEKQNPPKSVLPKTGTSVSLTHDNTQTRMKKA